MLDRVAGGGMQMITLEPGTEVPIGADWIAIARRTDDHFAVFGCVSGDRDVVVISKACKSYEEAKLRGWTWAEGRGAKLVYVDEASA